MNLLILDTETTGIDPDKFELLEIGAILYNVETRSTLSQMSSLFNIKNDNEAYNVNKIRKEAATFTPEELSHLSIGFVKNRKNYDYVVAHNAEFDRQWLIKKIDFDETTPWICTQSDFSWGDTGGKLDLVSIALSLGITVTSAHRALTDCNLLAQCFSKVDDLEGRIKKALLPREIYVARISFSEKDKAKNEGFVWDRLVTKEWAKKLTTEEAEKGFNFTIRKHL